MHHTADERDVPEYYGATLYFPDCQVFREPFLRISRTTPELLIDALAAELAKHARLHRAAKSTPCAIHGELNNLYRVPSAEQKRRLQWFISGTIETTWSQGNGAYGPRVMRGVFRT